MRYWVSEYKLGEILGREGAKKFLASFSGQRTYIPREASEGHKIARAIGLDAMQKLCVTYVGSYIEVPSGNRKSTAKQRILELHAQNPNLKRADISVTVGVGVRYVEQVLADAKRVA